MEVDRKKFAGILRGSDAGIAQLVEHDLAKVGVASSSLVSRSKYWHSVVTLYAVFATGLVAEWSCSGLQSRVRRFDSDLGLQSKLKRQLVAGVLLSGNKPLS